MPGPLFAAPALRFAQRKDRSLILRHIYRGLIGVREQSFRAARNSRPRLVHLEVELQIGVWENKTYIPVSYANLTRCLHESVIRRYATNHQQGHLLLHFDVMPAPPLRGRGWCFTINNPQEHEIRNLQRGGNEAPWSYICFGHEWGENETYHLQGYVHFNTNRRRNEVERKLGGRAYLEKRMGTTEQAITYCQKQGLFEEYGTKPQEKGRKNQTDWKEILKRAEACDYNWIKENHPRVWIQLSHRLQSLSNPEIRILDNIEHEWWIGETGTGKSRTLWELYPTHFQKELNKWWDGYSNQDVVAIEEWSPKNECTASHLKIWADRYPFTAQIKGGSLHQIRPKKLIVLSNYTIDQCFTEERDRLPLLRRFKTLRFPDDIQEARQNASTFQLANQNNIEEVDGETLSQATTVLDETILDDIDLNQLADNIEPITLDDML